MRKLIRSKVKKAFLTAQGQWTDRVRAAAHFTDYSQVQDAVLKFQLRDVELYYLFDDDAPCPYDFVLPLQGAPTPPSAFSASPSSPSSRPGT